MGFLNNLFKGETRKIISSVVSNAVDDLIGTSSDSATEGTGVKAGTARDEKPCKGERELRERLERVFAEEWSGYELRKKVSAAEMCAEAGARDYSYGVYFGGQPKAMLMVLNGSNEYNHKEVRAAQEACQRMGVSYMNFISRLPNRRSYISERLQNTIKA